MSYPNSILIPSQDNNFVLKKMYGHSQGHDILTQYRIHLLAQQILRQENNFDILRAPYLLAYEDWRPLHYTPCERSHFYAMETVNTSHPIWLGDRDSTMHVPFDILEKVNDEILRFFKMMWDSGFIPWGFELYLQPDGTIILLDFDKFGFHRPNWRWQVEYPCHWIHPEDTFRWLGYPQNFADRLMDVYHIRLENLQE
jgi:hypothetical protein